MKNAREIAVKYAEDVISGKKVAGEYIKLACKRFLADLQREDIVFKDKKVNSLIEFASCLKHYTGSHSGKPFVLEDWQIFIACNVYGFYWKETNTRRYNQSYVQIARKSGKTFMTTLFSLFSLIADGEDAAEVICAANTREQARISFEMAQTLCRQLDPSGKVLKVLRNEIRFTPNNSKLRAIAAEANTQDGFNASAAILDEYGGSSNTKMKDVIKSSMAMRSNPILFIITTAYFDKTSPCYSLREYGIEIIRELKEDDSFFVCIFEMDEDDEWDNPKNWVKSNPNMGVTVSEGFIRSEVNRAKQNPSDEVGVKTKTLNMWCDSSVIWIPSDDILSVSKKINLEDYYDKDWLCYCGVDLSAVSDLTALTFLLTDGDKYVSKTFYLLPSECLHRSENRDLYQRFYREGHLILTDGNVVDYDAITKIILQHWERLDLRLVGYDKWNATSWAVNAQSLGIPLQEFGQNVGNFSSPTKQLERLIKSKRIFIDNNPITRWNFANVILKEDWNENVKPTKEANANKIDGVISLIQALGVCERQRNYSGDIII